MKRLVNFTDEGEVEFQLAYICIYMVMLDEAIQNFKSNGFDASVRLITRANSHSREGVYSSGVYVFISHSQK